MKSEKEQNPQVVALQDNLTAIRKIAGWTAEEFGERIGVTKQTVSNLENKKTLMTFTQYIAIRAVLDYEIESNSDNDLLPKVLHILVDDVDSLNNDEYDKTKEIVKAVSLSAAGGVTLATLGPIFAGLASATAIPALITASTIGLTSSVTASWLKKLLCNKSKEKSETGKNE